MGSFLIQLTQFSEVKTKKAKTLVKASDTV